MNAYEKMREALVDTLDALKSLSKSHGTDLPEDVRALLGGMAFTVNAALAEPRRNCDVGTTEGQTARYNKFCYKNKTTERSCGDCPAYSAYAILKKDCRLAWAQMPYESEVAE